MGHMHTRLPVYLAFALMNFPAPDQSLSRQSLSPDLQVRIGLSTWFSAMLCTLRLKELASPITSGLLSL